MPFIQDWIHRIEEGGGIRYIKYLLLLFVFAVMVLSYNSRGFKNMSNLESMDAAQLARNISENKGYKTSFVRPFSMYLLQKAAAEKNGHESVDPSGDHAQLRAMHPDVTNPPLYPMALAGLMKVAPFKYALGSPKSIWNRGGGFWIYQPDFIISVFNQCLFLISVVLVFFIARHLFDSAVAWTSAIIFFGTDLYWRFSISGLSTMLVIILFLALTWTLLLLEQSAREPDPRRPRLMTLAVITGLLIGLGALTRYSYGFLIIPVLVFVILFFGRQRVICSLAILAAFALTMAPWTIRNYRLTHTLFGTAQYAMHETITPFTEHRLQRSLKPELSQIHASEVWFKFLGNFRTVLTEDLPRMGGTWVTALFLAGLLVAFRNPSLSRLRYFLLFAILVFAIVQALCRTQLTEDSPVINSENLLAILAPVVIIFGVSLFYTLLEQINFPLRQLRHLAIGAFCFVACIPMVLTFISPRVNAVAYPYNPPNIQKACNWMKPDELMMSDIPWAMAWYGNRQTMWLTLNAQQDFFAVHDYLKPIRALYLTPQTLDNRFLSQWVRAGESGWGIFVIQTVIKKEAPSYFPLTKSPPGMPIDQIFLTDRERWSEVDGP